MVHDPKALGVRRLTLSRSGVCERLGFADSELLKELPKFRHGHYDAEFIDLVVRVMNETGLRARAASKVARAIREGRLP